MSLSEAQRGSRGNDDWGKHPNQGPPDLEDLWRDLNHRISGIFDKTSKGSDGGSPPPRNGSIPKFPAGGVGAIVCILFAVWMASGFHIVDASQRAVVLQFGKYLETNDSGLHWRFPYPIQSHEIVDVSGVRTLEIGYRNNEKNKVLKEALMLTDDENIINIQFAVQYILKDPDDYLFKNRNPDEAVMQAAETAIREVVGKSKMDFVLYEGREQIAVQTQALIQQILDRYETGVDVSKVTMQGAQPPEQVQAAFDDAVKAGQDRERQKNEGQAYANEVIPRARGTAARLSEEAEAYRQGLISTAEGDASRFRQLYAEYAKAPAVTRNRLYLETMQEVYANTSKVMIDAKGQGNLLYLPLDKLVQAAGASIPPTVSSAGVERQERASASTTAVVPSQTTDRFGIRSRDTLRSRDRGGR
ncbi:MAG: FtsH protease activity modulator HflK [Candidatus Accumulibacter sp.]|jgi:membrane protease subunit HflK|nr:FtsH protease activity modulator HflK [Accumulibacter sp.]